MTTYADRPLTFDDVRSALSAWITHSQGDQFRARFCPECGESGKNSTKLSVRGRGQSFQCKCHKCGVTTKEVITGLGLRNAGDRYVPPPAAEFIRHTPATAAHPGKMAPPGSSPPPEPYKAPAGRKYLREIQVKGGRGGKFLYYNDKGDEAKHIRKLTWDGEKLPLAYDLKDPNWYLLHIEPDTTPEPGTPPGLYEGEKDTSIAADCGFDAFGTAGGASRAHHALINELVERAWSLGTGVIVFQDNDTPGAGWAHELIPDILRQGLRIFWPNPANLGAKDSFSDHPDRMRAIYKACREWTLANPKDMGKKRGKCEILITDLDDIVLTWKTQPLKLPHETRPFCKNKQQMARRKRREENWCAAAKGWQGEVSTEGIGTISVACGKCGGCQAHWADEKKGYHDIELTANVRRDVWTISSGKKALTPENFMDHRKAQYRRRPRKKFAVASYVGCETIERETPWDTDKDGPPIDPNKELTWVLIIEDPEKAGIEAYEAYKQNTEDYCKDQGLKLEIEPFADVSDAFLESLLAADQKRITVSHRSPITAISHWNWPRCYEERPLPQPNMSKYSHAVDTKDMELDGGMVVHLSEQQMATLPPEDHERMRWELQGRADKRAQLVKDKPEQAAMLSTREWMDGEGISLMLWRDMIQIVEEDEEAKAEAKAKGAKPPKARKLDIPGCKLKSSFVKSAVRAFMGLERYRMAYFEIYRRIGIAPPAEITRLAEFETYDKATLEDKFSIARPAPEPEPDEPTDEGDDIATATRRSYVPDWYREDHMAATIEFHDPYTQAEADAEGARIVDEVTFAMMAGDFNEAEYWLTNEWETLWNDRVQPGVYPPRNLLGRVRSAWDAIDDKRTKQS